MEGFLCLVCVHIYFAAFVDAYFFPLPAIANEVFFFFCLIILAFSLTKTMATNYLTVSHLPSHWARWQHPHPPFRQTVKTKERQRKRNRRRKQTRTNTPHIFRQTQGNANRTQSQEPVGHYPPGSSSSSSSLTTPAAATASSSSSSSLPQFSSTGGAARPT